MSTERTTYAAPALFRDIHKGVAHMNVITDACMLAAPAPTSVPPPEVAAEPPTTTDPAGPAVRLPSTLIGQFGVGAVLTLVSGRVASGSRQDQWSALWGLWSAFWTSGFFTWPGWASVQALGALGTVGALVVVIKQFQLSRDQIQSERIARREDYERSRTPDISIQIVGANAAPQIPVITCRLNADGRGVAYNVILNVEVAGVGPPPVGEAQVAARYLRAPGNTDYALQWPHGWGQERPVRIEIPYRSVFSRQYRVVHTGQIGGPEGIRITDEPTVERRDEHGQWVRWGLPD